MSAQQPVQLHVTTGQYSDKGRKPLNQDFHAVMVPGPALLASKGIALAIADGISSSQVSQVASETSVKGFLEDYYATSETWTVKTSALRVLQATNSWLYAQTRNGPYRYDIEKGYVCTISAIVFKSATAHIFHAGDSRVLRVVDNALEQLTEDHRTWLSQDKSYLSSALGMRDRLEMDYHSLAIETGDTFVLATDGVYEFTDAAFIAETIASCADNLDAAAESIVRQALANGSDDNLTIQIARVDQLPVHDAGELRQQAAALPFAPELRARMSFDGYSIMRELHHSHRSHVFLAVDDASGEQVVLKTPSVDLRNDDAYLESFLMEEWVARRVNSAHLLRPCELKRPRNYLYTVSEFIDGQTLAQWMTDNPNPDLETVRTIIEQVARGLQALHRQEMLHQDLRPANIMIDTTGTAKIIDFGAVRVAGVAETSNPLQQHHILGTAPYTAPEYFLGEAGTAQSDLFSLAVIAYQMLSGRLPYGTHVARASTRAAQNRLTYQSVRDAERTLPAWVDETLRRALQPSPVRRYLELSEFVYDLRHPNPSYLNADRAPLIERNPIGFWQGLSLVLLLALLFALGTHPLVRGAPATPDTEHSGAPAAPATTTKALGVPS